MVLKLNYYCYWTTIQEAAECQKVIFEVVVVATSHVQLAKPASVKVPMKEQLLTVMYFDWMADLVRVVGRKDLSAAG